MPVYSKFPLSLLYHHQNPLSLSPHTKISKCPSPAHLPSLNQIHNNVQLYTKLSNISLQHTTPHQLTATSDTHTEHKQMPHVHFHSCTYRCTVLCCTVLQINTGKIIPKRQTDRHDLVYLSNCSLYRDKGKPILFHNLSLYRRIFTTEETERCQLRIFILLVILLLLLVLLLPLPPTMLLKNSNNELNLWNKQEYKLS